MNSLDAPESHQTQRTSTSVDDRYQLIFRGVRDGFDRELLRSKFSQLFKIPSAQVERIFAAKRIRLKSDLTKEQAQTYREKLFALGFIVETPKLKSVITETQLLTPRGNPSIVSPQKPLPDTGVNEQEDAQSMHPYVEPPYGVGIQRMPVKTTIEVSSFSPLALANVLLCVISMGVWFPWAQMRHWRYCFAHTVVAGQSFEFRGHPHYLLVVHFFLVISAVGLVVAFFNWPVLFAVGLIGYLCLLPAYFGFKDVVSSNHLEFAGEKFYSKMTMRLAYEIFGFYPLVIVVTAGLAAPWAFKKMHEKLIATKSFGFFPLQISICYNAYLQLLKPLLAAWLLVLLIVKAYVVLPAWLILLLCALCLFGLISYWKLQLNNLLWNSVSCGLGRWQRELTWQENVSWQVKYYALFLLSAGLLTPWLNAFRWKMLAQRTAFLAAPRFKKWLKSRLES